MRKDSPIRKPIITDVKTNVNGVLSKLNPKNETLEVRILKTKDGTISGYYTNMEKLHEDIQQYNGKYNIYVTLNPCNN